MLCVLIPLYHSECPLFCFEEYGILLPFRVIKSTEFFHLIARCTSMMKYFVLAAALAACSCSAIAQTIRINEVVASNSVLLDEDGETSDWIELHNTSAVGVNLYKYRIADHGNYNKAWIFPDTTIPPGGFLVVRASGKNRYSSDSYTIEGVGSGINPWNTWDSFRFHYIPVSGDFDVSMRVHSLQKVGTYTKAGLLVLDSLTKYHRYAGVFATTRDVFTFSQRSMATEPPNKLKDAELSVNFPYAWVRLQRQGDTVYAYTSLMGDYWEFLEASFFSIPDGKGFVGVVVTGAQDEEPSRATLSHLTINGVPTSFAELIPKEMITKVAGTSYEGRELHTNFELKGSGETISLWDADGVLVDRLSYRELPTDVSFGREWDDDNEREYFAQPTPNANNKGEGKPRIAEKVRWSVESGQYDTPIHIVLEAANVSDRIFYTLDGSEPNVASPEFVGVPLLLTSTATVRARAIAENALPSAVETNTYLINEILHLPVVAMAADSMSLWGPDGIFRNIAYTNEVPVHIEFWEENGVQVLDQDAGMKLHGRVTRSLPQKPMRLYARSKYGVKTFNHSLFATKPIQSYKRLLLRSSGQDWNATYIRDALFTSAIAELNVDIQAYRPCVVFLNGSYWGIQNLRERVDEDFIADNRGADPDNLDFLEEKILPKRGSSLDYHALVDTLAATDMTTDEAREFFENRIDVENFIDYMSAEIYVSAGDWPQYNQRYWRERTTGSKWRWIMTDVDMGMGWNEDSAAHSKNVLAIATSPVQDAFINPPYSTFMLRTLLKNTQLRYRFINRTADILNTALQRERLLGLIDSLSYGIAAEVPRHVQRWDSSLHNWEQELNKMRFFVENRHTDMYKHFLTHFQLDDAVEVVLNSNIPHGGTIRFSTVTPTSLPWQGIYFTNVPITATAIPAPGYRFVRWSLDDVPDTSTIVLTLAGPLQLTAIFAKGEEVGDDGIVINEIMYKPSDDKDCEDWIELYNRGDGVVNMSGWVLSDDKDEHHFVFPDGTVLQAGGYLIVCRDTTAFRRVYPSIGVVLGNVDFGYGSPDQVRLHNAVKVLIDSVAYDSKKPWPTGAMGTGASIELLNPALDNNKGENWYASSGERGGSPGQKNGTDTGLGGVAAPITVAFACVPNPVQFGGTVHYTVAQSAMVRISLIDYLGRVVTDIVSQKTVAEGEHAVQFSTTIIPSGTYLLRLDVSGSTGHNVTTLPILIVR